MLHRYTFPLKNTCMKPKPEHQTTLQQSQQHQQQQQQHETYPASLLMNIINYDNNKDDGITPSSIKQIMRQYKQSPPTTTSKQSQRFNDNNTVKLGQGHIVSTPDSLLRLVFSFMGWICNTVERFIVLIKANQ